MSKWVRGGRKGGWGVVEKALGDGVGNGWGGKAKGGVVCAWMGGILLTRSVIGSFKSRGRGSRKPYSHQL